MKKYVFLVVIAVTGGFSNPLFSDCSCCPCVAEVDVELGWRKDDIKWKATDLKSHAVHATVNDKIFFEDLNSYTVGAHARFVSSDYYVKFSAEYGWTYKGRAHEHFEIKSPYLYGPISVHTNNGIKRNSEVYDFSGALGYPLSFCCSKFTIVPLIGFSFHRQHIRVKEKIQDSSHYSGGSSYYSSESEFFSDHSSSDFFVSSYNPFTNSYFSNPFSEGSESGIAGYLGLKNPHRTSTYRITWYGVYCGADMSCILDENWALYWDTEFHFLDNCHRKRKSWTGVHFVDEYHKKSGAWGFNNIIGCTYNITCDWVADLSVDFDWWKADAKHDKMNWKKIEAQLGLAYIF